MAKIGVGVTTFNRPECLKECLEHINKHTFMDNVTLYIATDSDEDRRGVAFRKNECLRALKDCDHIILLDDDTFPVKDGWLDYIILQGYHHLLFMSDKLHRAEHKGSVYSYLDCGGCFMYLSKKAVETVGAFNEKFSIYGFEHAEYSQRIFKAGLNFRPYLMAEDTSDYIYSHDYSTPNHKSSITDEEKRIHVKNNWDKFFKEPIKDLYLPL